MEQQKRFEKDYIEDVKLSKIKWVSLDAEGLEDFFRDNYLYLKKGEWVLSDKQSYRPIVFGMHYLSLYSPQDYYGKFNFLLGTVKNNRGKRTIVASAQYLNDYYIFREQKKPLTYISSMEVNSYFRNKGIYKKMCKELASHIRPDQHIVTSRESEMGAKCHTFEILERKLIENGFENQIFEDDSSTLTQEFQDLICSDEKVLSMKSN